MTDNIDGDGVLEDDDTTEVIKKDEPGPKVSRRDLLTYGPAALAVILNLTGGEEGNGVGEEVAELNEDDVEGVDSVPKDIGQLLARHSFEGESSGEHWSRTLALYVEVFGQNVGAVYFFDVNGRRVLGELTVPEGWKKWSDAKKQTWRDDRRKEAYEKGEVEFYIPGSYPHLSMPTHPFLKKGDPFESVSVVSKISERLNEKTQSPDGERYFKGKELTVRAAVEKICAAYEVPLMDILGLIAQESAGRKDLTSSANAYGLCQFLPATWNQVRTYVNDKRYVSKKAKKDFFRSKEVGKWNKKRSKVTEWKNRFVSIEMACAYYRNLQDSLKEDVEKLHSRLETLGAVNIPSDLLLRMASLNAYNAGQGNIQKTIKRFLKQDDALLLEKMGEGPYGPDVWLSVLSLSYKSKADNRRTAIGPDVYRYAIQIWAKGSLLTGEDHPFVDYASDGDSNSIDFSFPDLPDLPSLGSGDFRTVVSALLASPLFVKVLRGFYKPASSQDEVPADDVPKVLGMSRRRLLSAAALATAATFFDLPDFSGCKGDESEDVPLEELGFQGGGEFQLPRGLSKKAQEALESIPQIENSDRVVQAARAELVKKHETLKKKKTYVLTAAEMSKRKEYKQPQQMRSLEALIEKVYVSFEDPNALKAFRSSIGKKAPKRREYYARCELLQTAYLNREKNNLIEIPVGELADPNFPLFAQQVGKISGTSNSSEMCVTRKELILIMSMAIHLMNEQIDLFNESPESYGYKGFPKIPHVAQLKTSGALRTKMYQYELWTKLPGRTTPNVSAHTLAQALDVGALNKASSSVYMLRFKDDEALLAEDGSVLLGAGAKLPTAGLGEQGTQLRRILSRMMQRAFMSLEGPLKEHMDITQMFLWEGYDDWKTGQQNAHVVVKASGQ
jgi:hypothetical protein